MKCYQIIFSPTGGTEKVSKAITRNWQNLETIDLSVYGKDYSRISFDNDSLALIAVPVFGGVVPQLALDRLSEIKANGAKCVIVAVFGNRAFDNALVQTEDYAEKAGFKIIAAVSASAEHSIVREYGAGRPNEKDCKELSEYGDRILEKALGDNTDKPAIPGERPYKQSKTMLVPKADNSCISCGLCAKNCPAGAISVTNLKETEKNKCISCMRCVVQCPAKARKVNGMMVAAISAAIKKACAEEKPNILYI